MAIGNNDAQHLDLQSEDVGHDAPKTYWERFKTKMFRKEMLLVWTLMGVAVGLSLGAGLYSSNLGRIPKVLIGYPGEMMIRSLQLMILPLMTFALMSGVFSLRDTKTGSGRVVTWSLCYYLLSMVIAICIGIVMVYTVNPGKGTPFADNSASAACKARNSHIVNDTQSSVTSTTAVDSLLNLGRDLVPTNIVEAAAKPNYLGVMVFAITFAVFLVNMDQGKAEPIIKGIETCNLVIIKIISLVILITPIGIASWIANTILTACNLVHLLQSLALFVATILGGLALHFFVALPITMLVMARTNPFRAMKSWLPAFAMALGTSSSAATMPVSMNCARLHGCKGAIVNFVIPLGTNVNRDGTALYEAMAVIFICQANGRTLNVGQVFVVAIVATLAAMGTASIPNAGLITLVTALTATGNQQYIGDLSVLYAVDWMLGMFRTVTNVWGDACACCIVDRWARNRAEKEVMAGEADEEKSQRELKLLEEGENVQ